MSTVNAENKATPHGAVNNGHTLPSSTFEGVFVSMTGNHLVITNLEGKKCSHSLARDAKLTCDRTVCPTDKLKSGRKVRVTTWQENRSVAIKIEILDKQAEFPQRQ